MARQVRTGKKHETGRTITGKSAYGTHSDILIDASESLTKFLNEHPMAVIAAQDDAGPYLTYKDRVDSGLADPCRFDNKTRTVFSAQLLEIIDG